MSDTFDPFAALSNSTTGLVDNIDFDRGATTPVDLSPLPAVEVDSNDLSQWNHVEEIDPEARISDAIPPPPDGVHVMKLKVVKDGVKDEKKRVKGFDDNSVQFFYYNPNSSNPKAPIPANLQCMLVMDLQVDEEGKSGNGQSERRWISTMVDRERKTSEVDTFLRVLTGQAGAGMSNLAKIKKLHDLVVTEPKIKALTRWTAKLIDPVKKRNKAGVEKDDYPYAVVITKDEFGNEHKSRALGMKNFPVAFNSSGVAIGHKPISEDGETGAECRTKFETVAYYPLAYNG